MDTDDEYYSNSGVGTRASIQDLQERSTYQLDEDVQQGDLITVTIGKKIYHAKWLDRRGEAPIVLIEMSGERVSLEANLYLTLSHDHIIRTFGVVHPNDHSRNANAVLILQEYAKDADLGGLLEGRTFVPSQNVLLEIFIQIANAMIYVTENGVVHGDLGCRNVLVYRTHPHDPKQNLVKLTDFGLARPLSDASSSSNTSYPIRFAAPEIVRSHGRSGYSEKSDVYSFGVLMWEACSFGKIPYHNINNDNDLRDEKLAGTSLEKPAQCDINIWKLMRLCWKNKPDDRPRFTKIHKQLVAIQQIESSQGRPSLAASPSASSPSQEKGCLFPIEFQICSDCRLRYTHQASHANQCTEQKLMCGICSQEYRRAVYDNHIEHCTGALEQNNLHPSSSTPSLLRKPQRLTPSPSLPSYRLGANNKSRVNELLSSPLFHGGSDHFSSRRSSRLSERRISVSSSSTIDSEMIPTASVQLPCELCNKPINISRFDLHLISCKKEDQKRIEDMRKRIENETKISKIPCEVCGKDIPTNGFDAHAKSCSNLSSTKLDESSSSGMGDSGRKPSLTPSPPKSTKKPGIFSKFKSIFSSNK